MQLNEELSFDVTKYHSFLEYLRRYTLLEKQNS